MIPGFCRNKVPFPDLAIILAQNISRLYLPCNVLLDECKTCHAVGVQGLFQLADCSRGQVTHVVTFVEETRAGVVLVGWGVGVGRQDGGLAHLRL